MQFEIIYAEQEEKKKHTHITQGQIDQVVTTFRHYIYLEVVSDDGTVIIRNFSFDRLWHAQWHAGHFIVGISSISDLSIGIFDCVFKFISNLNVNQNTP